MDDVEQKPLSPAELKKLKKAEKAARRKEQKGEQGVSQAPQQNRHKPSNKAKPDSTKPGTTAHKKSASTDTQSTSQYALGTLLGHLELRPRLGAPVPEDVNSAVFELAVRMSAFQVLGSTERCRQMLLAFQRMIREYRTPPDTLMARSLNTHLGKQIEYLKQARPLSVSMGNAIRWLKQEISKCLNDSEDVVKDNLVNAIEDFIRDKLDAASQVISQLAVPQINDGAVIMTFAHSSVVSKVLRDAKRGGKDFRVIVVDSRPLLEGKKLLQELQAADIPCSYVFMTGLHYVLSEVTAVVLGAHAMFSNGMLYSRAGTALVAQSATDRNIPVLVYCESIKFSDRVQLDALTTNELGRPEDMNLQIGANTSVKALHVLYDLTPPDCIRKIVTELGNLPPSSVPVVIREYRNS
ncbi:hypothetical protein CANCADRAFT_31671 [Tortispora caseinolytica NRRL Y-17796]|uniref:Translation initiation factor eIF2B subunit delta n=1 Tax=Tortispora caseinolytica NRRL Y-17796 TaxID=767744 RepID=A0A1E4TGC7_9ASCO|nr:hypothetical protein CANCADRAFT_31671 [Tortispora caseinolytica NRRL Y-17796]